MRKIFLLLLLLPMLGVSQVLTIGGEVLKHSNYVLRKNYITIGGTAWVEKAPKLGTESYILSLCVYNGKLYGSTATGGRLYEWNGSNALETMYVDAEYRQRIAEAGYKLATSAKFNGEYRDWETTIIIKISFSS